MICIFLQLESELLSLAASQGIVYCTLIDLLEAYELDFGDDAELITQPTGDTENRLTSTSAYDAAPTPRPITTAHHSKSTSQPHCSSQALDRRTSNVSNKRKMAEASANLISIATKKSADLDFAEPPKPKKLYIWFMDG